MMMMMIWRKTKKATIFVDSQDVLLMTTTMRAVSCNDCDQQKVDDDKDDYDDVDNNDGEN